jgi:hypothetical protein
VTRLPYFLPISLICGIILLCAYDVRAAQQRPASPPDKPTPRSAETSEKQPELPAQIELLETHVRFEANGDSRKEVHTRVHINNELGARQFARLTFDYNRSFQQIQFPQVRITHQGGGTVDILPSAIADQPNPAVVNAPAYQDVRVKSVRILGLAPGDTLEYRVITATANHPLAPDFWLDHTFDRSGIVSREAFVVEFPKDGAKIQINPATQPIFTDQSAEASAPHTVYRWERDQSSTRDDKSTPAKGPDIVLTSFESWPQLSTRLSKLFAQTSPDPAIVAQATELTAAAGSAREKLQAVYAFVSQQIHTVPLRLEATGYRPRPPAEILSSKSATALDKYALFSALAVALDIPATAALSGISDAEEPPLFRPSIFTRILIMCGPERPFFWLDPSLEVAPFGLLPPDLRDKRALLVYRMKEEGVSETFRWDTTPKDLPFASSQKVFIDASLAADGNLSAKVHYALRGDNELLLRVAFHQSPKEKWKEVAQLLALSDGFRGKVTNVTASDPYATKAPYIVEYEITQPKFVDWSKKPVRIPALLPLLGLPDPPAKPTAGAATSPIDLGTPLDVETHLTLHLPAGTVVRPPTGTAVDRDYAAFASKYQASVASISASRHLDFLMREIPADRAADYNAFVRAVQSDEAQEFTLEQAATAAPKQAVTPKKN